MKFLKKKNISNKKSDFEEIIDYPHHIKILNKNNFNDFINHYPLTVVDFWAPWCKPCKNMTPRIRRLSSIYKGKLAFGKINVYKNNEISKQYKIMSIPNLTFFRSGKIIKSITGLRNISEIKDIIDNLLKN